MKDAVKPSRRSSLTISDRFGNQQTNCWFYRFFWSTSGAPPTPQKELRHQNGSTGAGGRAAASEGASSVPSRGTRQSWSSVVEVWTLVKRSVLLVWHQLQALSWEVCTFSLRFGVLVFPPDVQKRQVDGRCARVMRYISFFLMTGGFCVFIATGIRKSSCIISCLTVQRLTGSAWHQSAWPKRPTRIDLQVTWLVSVCDVSQIRLFTAQVCFEYSNWLFFRIMLA